MAWSDWIERAVRPIRPIFRNLEVGEYKGDKRKQFDVTSRFLPMLNPINRQGTLHVAGNMNNMIDFDNHIAMGSTEYTFDRISENEFYECFTEPHEEHDEASGESMGKRLILERTSLRLQRNPTRWRITDTLYDLNADGENVEVQRRIITYTKKANGWGAIIE